MAELAALLADLQSGDAARAEAAAQALPEHGTEALAALDQLLDDPQADTRWWAARCLAEINAEGVAALLEKALADTDSSVQAAAAISVRKNPIPEAVSPLVGLLAGEDQMLARLAGDALVAIGEPATLELIDVLENGGQQAQVGAARALAQIGDLCSVSALFKLLDSDSAMLEHWASEGLEKMGIGMTFFGMP
jgi:HEAT repeat protein